MIGLKNTIKTGLLIASLFVICWQGYAQTNATQTTVSQDKTEEVYKAENPGWLVNIDEAYALSKKSGKPIMANFTGSDWCGWCKRLTASVFSQDDFKNWAEKNVVLLELDFPRRKALPQNIQAQNASLQQAFQVSGYLRSLNDADNESMAGPPSLILSGPNGTGKTHIARASQWSLVLAVLDDDGRAIDDLAAPACRWYAAADLLGSLGETRDNDGFFYSGRPSQLVGNAPFVVLDDVAAELSIPFVAYPAQEAERQIRYHLFFDWCVANRVPVVLTTNFSAAGPESDLARHVGPHGRGAASCKCPRAALSCRCGMCRIIA